MKNRVVIMMPAGDAAAAIMDDEAAAQCVGKCGLWASDLKRLRYGDIIMSAGVQ